MMDIWTAWTDLITHSLTLIGQQFGLSEALAIVVITLLVRLVLLPVSYGAAYGAYRNKQKLQKMQPELERLKSLYQEDPAELAKRSMALYRKHNIRLMDKVTLVNLGAQGMFGIGFTSALAKLALSSPFLWISSIARSDAVLALVVGMLTYLMMWLTPGMAEQGSTLMVLIPALFAAGILLTAPASIGLYWLVSNLVSVLQTLWLRQVIVREARLMTSHDGSGH